MFRIRQLGEKQKIKEKSRERENPNGDSTKDSKDPKSSKIPTKVSESRVPPSQVIRPRFTFITVAF